MPATTVHHNLALGRFEIEADGLVSFLEYVDQAGVMTITHTLVPPALRGQGLAGILTEFACQTARRQNKKIDPQCSYATAYLQRHPEYADVCRE